MSGKKFGEIFNLNFETKVFVLLFLLIPVLCTGNGHKSHFIELGLRYVDISVMQVQPGDTLLIEAGIRRSLKIANLKGDSLNYIVVKNYGGDVIIKNDDFHYGFSFSNCSFFRVTGSYKNEEGIYGIKILGTGTGASGLSFDNLSTNYEADHIEIANTGFSGIFAFSQPTIDLSANRGHFVQRNTIIRDNYIHDTGGEGMYIGHSFYNGYQLTSDNQTYILYPHEIIGLKVYNNILKNTGYDGLQICCAVEDAEVFNNSIYNYGTLNQAMQHSGIQIGAGSKLRCYNNTILDGSGTGIMMLGFGGSYIYNNLIVNAGKDFFPNDPTIREYGIFVDDRCTLPNTSFYILNNTIIKPKSDGIRFYSTISRKNLIANNLIIKPGSKYLYEPGNYSFIYPRQGSEIRYSSNFFTNQFMGETVIDSNNIQNSIDSLKLHIGELQLQQRGTDVSEFGILTDYFNQIRMNTPSIGAFEYFGDIVKSMKIQKDINLLHNDGNSEYTIENNSSIDFKTMTIYNLCGTIVYQKAIDVSGIIRFNVKGILPNGIYLLKIQNSEQYFSSRFYIN